MGATKNIVFENLLALLIAVEKKCTQEVAFKYLDQYMQTKNNCKKKLNFKWTDEVQFLEYSNSPSSNQGGNNSFEDDFMHPVDDGEIPF